MTRGASPAVRNRAKSIFVGLALTCTTAVALPHIPIDAFDFNPTGGDIATVEELQNVLVPGGYDALRAHAFDEPGRAISVSTGMMIVEGTYSPPL